MKRLGKGKGVIKKNVEIVDGAGEPLGGGLKKHGVQGESGRRKSGTIRCAPRRGCRPRLTKKTLGRNSNRN